MPQETVTDDHAIDMNEVVRLLKERGVPAYVEHTGGGCATIYAGSTYPDPDDPDDVRYPCLAGPGTFPGRWQGGVDEPAVGYPGDFCIGPDDDGESEAVYPPEGATAVQVADIVEEYVNSSHRGRA